MTAKAIARIGDLIEGVCKDHDGDLHVFGHWVKGSNEVDADGIKVIRIGDTGIADCGCTFVAVTGSTISDEDGIPFHRIDDIVHIGNSGGIGISITGSPTVILD